MEYQTGENSYYRITSKAIFVVKNFPHMRWKIVMKPDWKKNFKKVSGNRQEFSKGVRQVKEVKVSKSKK